uniref:Uncharacterized protein n=1 Tax=Anguilla anguilla TaxID=7936 RepID=A0A0E9QQY2_ANGAN
MPNGTKAGAFPFNKPAVTNCCSEFSRPLGTGFRIC